MDGFYWDVDGEQVKIIFSMIRDAEWLNDEHDAVFFDYLDHLGICVMKIDLEDEDGILGEYEQEVWSMLLQASDLDAS